MSRNTDQLYKIAMCVIRPAISVENEEVGEDDYSMTKDGDSSS